MGGSLGLSREYLEPLPGSFGAFLLPLGFLLASYLLLWGSLGPHLLLSGFLGSLGVLLGLS